MPSTAVRRFLAVLAVLATALGLAVVLLAPSAAEAKPRRCHRGYPAVVTTQTTVDLVKSVGEYGDRNAARIKVRSDAGVPRGEVTVGVAGVVASLRLHGGVARWALPRYLPASHTYAVTATYTGRGCFGGSSGSAYYTVVPAHHHPHGHHGHGPHHPL
jgi:hypothetical protein